MSGGGFWGVENAVSLLGRLGFKLINVFTNEVFGAGVDAVTVNGAGFQFPLQMDIGYGLNRYFLGVNVGLAEFYGGGDRVFELPLGVCAGAFGCVMSQAGGSAFYSVRSTQNETGEQVTARHSGGAGDLVSFYFISFVLMTTDAGA